MFKKIVFYLFAAMLVSADDWRTATRESAGIAPLPSEQPQAVVQVYAARTVKWRGYFGVHSWISTKEKDATEYTVYHVVGWRVRRGLNAVVIEKDIPDRHWYGAKPSLVSSLVGPAAESAIVKIKKAAVDYPYQNSYRVWPGPNSNTFVSFILRQVPEIGVELPPHAIGRDWINDGDLVGITESNTGLQLSLFGLLGFSIGAGEGLEVNILGLNFGVDILRPALKLPMIGRIGFDDAPVFSTKPEPQNVEPVNVITEKSDD